VLDCKKEAWDGMEAHRLNADLPYMGEGYPSGENPEMSRKNRIQTIE